MSVYVLDSKSGLPVRDARVIVAEQKWAGSSYKLTKMNEASTDKKGFCSYMSENNYRNEQVFIENGNDKFFTNYQYRYFNNNDEDEDEDKDDDKDDDKTEADANGTDIEGAVIRASVLANDDDVADDVADDVVADVVDDVVDDVVADVVVDVVVDVADNDIDVVNVVVDDVVVDDVAAVKVRDASGNDCVCACKGVS